MRMERLKPGEIILAVLAKRGRATTLDEFARFLRVGEVLLERVEFVAGGLDLVGRAYLL